MTARSAVIGDPLDIETRRKKQRALVIRAVERKVRSRAQELYESRGQTEGQELQDWFQAESEVVEKNAIASIYRRERTSSAELNQDHPSSDLAPSEEHSPCETSA